MGGAPITVTLYKNGIHISHGKPAFFQSKGMERLLREAFDRGEDTERLLWGAGLVKLLERVEVAIDCTFAEDRRTEMYVPPSET